MLPNDDGIDALLRKYLLGDERYAEICHTSGGKLLTDVDFSSRLSMAADDLMEDFLDDMLTASEVDKFLSYFLLVDGRRDDLWLIRILRRFANSARARPRAQQ